MYLYFILLCFIKLGVTASITALIHHIRYGDRCQIDVLKADLQRASIRYGCTIYCFQFVRVRSKSQEVKYSSTPRSSFFNIECAYDLIFKTIDRTAVSYQRSIRGWTSGAVKRAVGTTRFIVLAQSVSQYSRLS